MTLSTLEASTAKKFKQAARDAMREHGLTYAELVEVAFERKVTRVRVKAQEQTFRDALAKGRTVSYQDACSMAMAIINHPKVIPFLIKYFDDVKTGTIVDGKEGRKDWPEHLLFLMGFLPAVRDYATWKQQVEAEDVEFKAYLASPPAFYAMLPVNIESTARRLARAVKGARSEEAAFEAIRDCLESEGAAAALRHEDELRIEQSCECFCASAAWKNDRPEAYSLAMRSIHDADQAAAANLERAVDQLMKPRLRKRVPTKRRKRTP